MSAAPSAPPRPLGRSLVARLLLLALAQLLLLTVAGLGIAQLLRPPAPRDLGALAAAAAARITPALAGSSEAIPDALATAAREGNLELTLYGPDGSVRASTVEPPLALGPPPRGPHHGPPDDLGPPPEDRGPPGPPGLLPFDGGPGPPPHTVPVGDHRLSVRPARPAPVYLGALLTVLAGLLVLGVGGVVTARWIVAPLDRLGRAAEAIAAGDLAARTGVRRDDEIGEVAAAFDAMATRIERLLKKERELLANVSHELRTPLARIRVALDLATEGHASALEGVGQDLEELESIVESILSAARMERTGPGELDAGLPAHSLREVDAAEIVQASVARFRQTHPARRVELALTAPLAPLLVEPSLVRRVLGNLLDNAHKYSPDAEAPITVRAHATASAVEIEVVDRGIGIESADLARVFEPFFRAERSRTRTAGGVGLGLTLSRRIVEAHGGTLELGSRPGEGTTARVSLPRRPPVERSGPER